MQQFFDKNGKPLKIGDIVHDDFGFDLIVKYDKIQKEYYGELVCDKNDSCTNIPYFLISEHITFIKHKN